MENPSPQHLISDNLKLQKLYNELHRINQKNVDQYQHSVKKNLKKIKLDTLLREFHQRLNQDDY